MKVKVTYTETQTFVMVTEIDMTSKEYKEYLKKPNNYQHQRDLNHSYDLSAMCGDEHHVLTEVTSIELEKA